MNNLTNSDAEYLNARLCRHAINDAVVSFGDIENCEYEELNDLFGGWLHEGSATLLHGATGLGKSQFAMSIACCVAGGGSFGGWSAPSDQYHKVLYLDGEMGMQSLVSMSKRLGAMVGCDFDRLKNNLKFLSTPDSEKLESFDLGQKVNQRQIMKYMDDNDIELLVVDNVRTLIAMDDENSKEGWQALSDFVTELRTYFTVLVLHHDNKSGDFAGSSHAPTVMDYRVQLSEANATHALRGCGCAFTVDFHKVRRLATRAHSSRKIGLHPAKGWIVQNDRVTQFNAIYDAAMTGQYTTQRALADAFGILTPKLNKLLSDFDPSGDVKAAIESAKRGDDLQLDGDCPGVDALLDD